MASTTPAMAAQRRVLADILATGCAAPALSAAVDAAGCTANDDALATLQTLPLTTYQPPYSDAAAEAVAALRAGDIDAARGCCARLLTRVDMSDIRAFFMTSGTTGTSGKLFAWTAAGAAARAGFFHVLTAMNKRKTARIMAGGGKRLGLAVPGLPQEVGGLGKSTIYIGPVTTVMLGPPLKRVAAATADATSIDDDDANSILSADELAYPVRVLTAFDVSVAARQYLMWLCTLAQGGDRVVVLADFFAGSLPPAIQLLRDHVACLAADLRAGKLAPDFPAAVFGSQGEPASSLPAAVCAAVDACIGGPKPHVASALEAAVAAESASSPLLAALLPNVAIASAIWSGSMAKYQGPVTATLPPSTVCVTEFYGGSEGMYGFNEQMLQPGGWVAAASQRFVLCPVGDVVFEFVEVADDSTSGTTSADGITPPAVFMDGVKVGTSYELVVTTFGGLARYCIGDVVRVVDTVASLDAAALADGDAELEASLGVFVGAPIVEFVGRSADMLNLVWEKYGGAAIVNALGGEPAWSEFAVREEAAPRDGGPPFYVVYVEPAPGRQLDAGATAAGVDAALARGNDVYALLRSRNNIRAAQVAKIGRAHV